VLNLVPIPCCYIADQSQIGQTLSLRPISFVLCTLRPFIHYVIILYCLICLYFINNKLPSVLCLWDCVIPSVLVFHKFPEQNTRFTTEIYYYLLQLSCHSVAVVLTDKTNKNKYTETKQYKNTVQTVHNTVNTSTDITKTPTQLSKHPHITKQVKTTTVQDTHQMKWWQYNRIPSVQGHSKVHGTFASKNFTVTRFTPLNFKTESFHINQTSSLHMITSVHSTWSRQFTPHDHVSSLHIITSVHSTWSRQFTPHDHVSSLHMITSVHSTYATHLPLRHAFYTLWYVCMLLIINLRRFCVFWSCVTLSVVLHFQYWYFVRFWNKTTLFVMEIYSAVRESCISWGQLRSYLNKRSSGSGLENRD
jgi:hypothetical protein